MAFGIIELIILFAAAQGVFLAVLILHKHGNLFANRFLVSLILLYSVLLLHLFFGDIGYPTLYYRLAPLVIGLAFFMIPLHYLYAKYLVENVSAFCGRDYLHFVPFIVWEVFWILAILFLRDSQQLWRMAIGSSDTTVRFVLFNWLVLVQAGFYMLRTVHILNRYARQIKEVFSSIHRIRLDWLRNMTYLILAMLVIFLAENVLNLFGSTISSNFTLSSLLVAVYVYTIGYLGLFNSEVFTNPEVAESISYLPGISASETGSVEKSAGGKYQKSGLSPERSREYADRLVQLMEEDAPYTDSDLTLDQLAEMMGISPHNLSEIINTRLNQNFFDFVNGYRIEQVKADLTDPGKENYTVLGIAYDAGFNSKSSFYTIFKKCTGMTPAEYRRQYS